MEITKEWCINMAKHEAETGGDCNAGSMAFDPELSCNACKEVGMWHCSDPENCGGPWDKRHDVVGPAGIEPALSLIKSEVPDH